MNSESLKSEIDAALEAHGAWKQRLRTAAIARDRSLPVADICRDDRCRFGKWLLSIPPGAADPAALDHARDLHRAFHVTAGDIARKIAGGEGEAALRDLQGPLFNDRSSALSRHLMAWKRSLG